MNCYSEKPSVLSHAATFSYRPTLNSLQLMCANLLEAGLTVTCHGKVDSLMLLLNILVDVEKKKARCLYKHAHACYNISSVLFIQLFTSLFGDVWHSDALCESYSLLSWKSFLLYSVIIGLVKEDRRDDKRNDMQQSFWDELMSKYKCHQLWQRRAELRRCPWRKTTKCCSSTNKLSRHLFYSSVV